MDGIILNNMNLCSKIVLCGSSSNKKLVIDLLLVPSKRCWVGFKSQEPKPLRFNLGTNQHYGKLLALHQLFIGFVCFSLFLNMQKC
jgi:hypothetical protein